MKKSMTIAAAVALGLVAVQATAHANTFDLRLDTNFLPKESVTAAAPVARLAVPLGGLTLRADWGLTIADVSSQTGVKPLNPFIGVGYDLSLGVMNLTIAGGVALPILRISGDDEVASVAAASIAASMVGYWDPWLYEPNSLSLAFPARLDLNIPGIDAMVEGGLYFSVGTSDGEDSELGMQAAAEIAFPLLPVLSLGARLQTVYLVTAEGLFQTSAEPFAQVGLGPLAVRAGLLVNIDEPAGFGFDSNKIWSAHLGVRLAL